MLRFVSLFTQQIKRDIFLFLVGCSALFAIGLQFPFWISAARINVWSVLALRFLVGKDTSLVLSEPVHPRGAVWLARNALSLGDIDTAKKVLSPFLQQPYAPEVMSMYGWVLVVDGDSPGALKMWQQVRDLQSIDRYAWQLTRDGKLELARDAFEWLYDVNVEKYGIPYVQFLWKSYKRPDLAIDVLKETLPEYTSLTDKINGWLLLGDISLSMEKWDEARDAYQHVLSMDTNEVRAWVGLGNIEYAQSHALDRAMEQFRYAISICPECGDGYFAMAKLLEQEGSPQAAQWYEAALQASPDNQWYALSWAQYLRGMGRIGESIQVLQQILETYPRFAEGYYELALSYQAAGHACNQGHEAILHAIEIKKDPRYLNLEHSLLLCSEQ